MIYFIQRYPLKDIQWKTVTISLNPDLFNNPKLPKSEKGSNTPFKLLDLFIISYSLNLLLSLKSLYRRL